MEETIDRLEVPVPGSQPLHFPSVFAQSQVVQYWELLKRNLISYSRNPAYNGTRCAALPPAASPVHRLLISPDAAVVVAGLVVPLS